MAAARSTNRVFLVSSVLLGVVAMVAAFVYLENSGGQEKGPKTTILVAKRDLRENTSIDPDKDLTELEIPCSWYLRPLVDQLQSEPEERPAVDEGSMHLGVRRPVLSSA